MSDPNNPNATPSNGDSPSGEPAGYGARAAATRSRAKALVAARFAAAKAHPQVQRAITSAKAHPLGAVATVAAAAALVEIEFAVGILTGLGATALLATKSGPEARDQVIARGRQAIERARVALAKRKESLARKRAGRTEAEAPPPAA